MLFVPCEASMAPAVSWKSSSCCRNRMACGRRAAEVKVSIGYSLHRKNTARYLEAVPMETAWIHRHKQTASRKDAEFEVERE